MSLVTTVPNEWIKEQKKHHIMILSATFNHEVQSEVKEDWDRMSESDLHSLALFPPAVTILKLFFPPTIRQYCICFLVKQKQTKALKRDQASQ